MHMLLLLAYLSLLITSQARTMSTIVINSNIEVLDYNDLVSGADLSGSIARAFGADGPGILTVKNIPGIVEARNNLLPLARVFSELDEDTKLKYGNYFPIIFQLPYF